MKQYVVDELRPSDQEKIKAYLDGQFGQAAVDGVYWLPIEEKQLSGIQLAHVSCQPFCFAVELETHRLTCELLVRTQNRIRCDCIQYATQNQRNWLIEWVDATFDKLGIMT